MLQGPRCFAEMIEQGYRATLTCWRCDRINEAVDLEALLAAGHCGRAGRRRFRCSGCAGIAEAQFHPIFLSGTAQVDAAAARPRPACPAISAGRPGDSLCGGG